VSEINEQTYLGIDYGRRRIGLAKTDPTATIATALETITVKSQAEAVEKVGRLIGELKPVGLVIGYPLHESGEPSDMCAEIDGFLEKLSETYSGPVYRIDEFGSSQEAASIVHKHGKRSGRDKQKLDRLAAVVILERFLRERQSQ